MGKKKAVAQGGRKARASAGQQTKKFAETNQGAEGANQKDEVRLRNCEWIMERMQKKLPPIYTMDIETDPFARDHVPVPFVVGIYDGLTYWRFWSDKKKTCIEKAKEFFEDQTIEPGIVYMHNGGRYDFFFMIDWFEGRTMIIGARIVRAFMEISQSSGRRSWQKRFDFRDSFAIMPFPLAAYQKDKIEIDDLRRENRAANKAKIEKYLFGDCFYLWEMCMEFQREFGDRLTIASAAFTELTNFHSYDQLPTSQDADLRDKFYFGGRVQCFQKGLVEGPVKIYDVNSMYPFVMDSFFHPISWCNMQDERVHGWNSNGTFNDDKFKTFFLTVEGENNGAFAQRKPDGGIDFTTERGRFHVTIHEYLAAMELGLFKLDRIIQTYNFLGFARFHTFVDHFYKKREAAKIAGDKMHTLFYKYILNSAYGKFGLNPENYFNWQITKTADEPKGPYWQLDTIAQGKYYVWKQPNQLPWNVKNIATAASITGAARSMLLRAIAFSRNVLYCDTDSIICEQLIGCEIDDKKLGQWKLEGTGVRSAIAGKKMYAIFDDTGACIKSANKGVDIKPEDILTLVSGQSIFSAREAPTFKRDGSATFISRTVRMTA